MTSEQAESPQTTDQAIKARLRWRCRRGMAEMDQLLIRFLDRGYDALGPTQRLHFEAVLQMEDDQLWACFLRRQMAPDASHQALIELILHTANA